MARTYRLRHCPSLPGTAKHFAFTHANWWLEREKLVIEMARQSFPQIFSNPSVVGQHRNRLWWAYRRQGDIRSILDTLEAQIIVPLMSPHSHPWRRHGGINVRIAKSYRAQAHRNIRRQAKHLLNKSGQDYNNMLMPLWYEYWDRWMID